VTGRGAGLSPDSIFTIMITPNYKNSTRFLQAADNPYAARHIQQFLTYQSPIVPTSEVDMMRARIQGISCTGDHVSLDAA
jgi:hypothetical protein